MAFKQFRVTPGTQPRLAEFDTGDTAGIASKKEAKQRLAEGIERLKDLQERLYAQDRWAVLVILQAMDAAGKDSTIEHVMSGLNPQGCEVHSFKAPSAEELDHDFLWRTNRRLPERGRIGVFNRSYYEEVLVVRVHPELLEAQKLPQPLVGPKLWRERFEDINALERYLTRNGTVICKFFLHVSAEEQRQRFLRRLTLPEKHWKFALRDVEERKHWDRYMNAYEDMIAHTSTPYAPWHVIPADHKWFMRLAVGEILRDTLESLHLRFPKLSKARRKELGEARAALERTSGESGKKRRAAPRRGAG
jgi:PPK2 family polyphosphate:nucleotide phosphotransferase